ncbi:MAG: hypothetical protein ACOYL6_19155 [Bacteriovoracaceae bacterium]
MKKLMISFAFCTLFSNLTFAEALSTFHQKQDWQVRPGKVSFKTFRGPEHRLIETAECKAFMHTAYSPELGQYPERAYIAIRIADKCKRKKSADFGGRDYSYLEYFEGSYGYASVNVDLSQLSDQGGTYEKDNWFKYFYRAEENSIELSVKDMDQKPSEYFKIVHEKGKFSYQYKKMQGEEITNLEMTGSFEEKTVPATDTN